MREKGELRAFFGKKRDERETKDENEWKWAYSPYVLLSEPVRFSWNRPRVRTEPPPSPTQHAQRASFSP